MLIPSDVRRGRASLWGALVLAACLFVATAQVQTAAAGDDAAFETARRMGRGINILGYDGLWDGGVNAPFRPQYFRMIRDAGFRHVRINLHGFKYMDKDNRIDPRVLERLDWVLGETVRANLIPVIDEHDFHECQRAPAPCLEKLLAFWTQVAERYAGKFPDAVFEILNEPGGSMTQELWNAFIPRVLNVVRRHDRARTIIMPAINSEDAGQLRALRLPENDRNLIVTVHYYKPIQFTHQGAEWSSTFAHLRDIEWGSEDDLKLVRNDFDIVEAWSKETRRPIYLGEFGVYERAGLQRRSRYIAFIAREAERRGWSWAYWQFDHDFALYDVERESWIRPLLDALIPPARR